MLLKKFEVYENCYLLAYYFKENNKNLDFGK